MQSVAVGLEASISLRNRLCNSWGSPTLVSHCNLLHLFLPLLIVKEKKSTGRWREDAAVCCEFCPETSCCVTIVTSSFPWQYRTLKRAHAYLFEFTFSPEEQSNVTSVWRSRRYQTFFPESEERNWRPQDRAGGILSNRNHALKE